MDKQGLTKEFLMKRLCAVLRHLCPPAVLAGNLCLLARPVAASVLEYQAPLLPMLVLLGAVVIAAGAYLWVLRKVSIFRDAMGPCRDRR